MNLHVWRQKEKKNMFKVHLFSHYRKKKVLFCTKFISTVTKLLNWTEQIISFGHIRNDGLLCYVSILKE